MKLKFVKNLKPENQTLAVNTENPLTSQTHFPDVQNGIIHMREWCNGQDSNKIRVCESAWWAVKDSAHVTDYQK